MSRSLSFPSLTGLRAMAAYLVFFHHFPFSNPTLSHFCFQGYIGVSIFFTISGFLITYIYSSMRITINSYLKYLWKRIARIYPVYLLALFTLVWLSSGTYDAGWWFNQLTLIKGFHDYSKFEGIAQSWSITLELTFYLLAPWLIIGLKSKAKYFVLPVLYLIAYLLSLTGYFGSFQFVLVFTFFGRALEIIVGCLIALEFSKLQKLDYIKYKTYVGLISLLVILILLDNFGAPYTSVYYILNFFIMPIAVSTLLIGIINEKNLITKVLSSPLFQVLGKSSYTFYLFQFIVIRQFAQYFQFTQNLNIILGFLLLNAVSIIIYYLFEAPVHKFLLSGIAFKWRLLRTQLSFPHAPKSFSRRREPIIESAPEDGSPLSRG